MAAFTNDNDVPVRAPATRALPVAVGDDGVVLVTMPGATTALSIWAAVETARRLIAAADRIDSGVDEGAGCVVPLPDDRAR